MNGLELARRYYLEVGRPMLEAEYAEYLPRIAPGKVPSAWGMTTRFQGIMILGRGSAFG